MRTLVISLASLALVGCGGLDETALPNQTSTSVPALGGLPSPSDRQLEEPLPMPVVGVIGARRGGDALQLVQVPVEERYFYPVDVNVPPPEIPPPPCPACR